MYRRGHVPTLLVFIVALVLALTAWYTFLTFKSGVATPSDELGNVIYNLDFSQIYIEKVFTDSVVKGIETSNKADFENSFKTEFEKVVADRDLRLDQGGNFFAKIRNKDYKMSVDHNVHVLTVENVSIFSSKGNNEAHRNFNLSIRFTPQGAQ